MDKKITIAQIKEVAQQAYDLYKTNTDLHSLSGEYQ